MFAAAYPELGIGFAGVALAFGLNVLTMVYAISHISGPPKPGNFYRFVGRWPVRQKGSDHQHYCTGIGCYVWRTYRRFCL